MKMFKDGALVDMTPQDAAFFGKLDDELAKEHWATPAGVSADSWYAYCVDREIKTRYSQSAENALLRQRDSKPDEFAVYNEFCEECKRFCKQQIAKFSE